MNTVHPTVHTFLGERGSKQTHGVISLTLLTAQLESAQMIVRISREKTDRTEK